MNSVNRLLMVCLAVLALVIWRAPDSHAEGAPFTVSSTELEPAEPNEDAQNLIGRLKYRAVVNWLQSHLGTRYEQFAEKVTPEFAERYILEYKVSRPQPNNKNLINLTGTLDADSLKRWLRVAEVKTQGSSVIKSLFVLSSDAPGLGFLPRDTGLRIKDSGTAQILFNHLNAHFQKFNTRLTPAEGSSLSLTAPPRTSGEIKALSDSATPGGFNGAIWLHISACKSCGGSRLDLYFYNLAQNRVGLARSEDLALEGRDFSNSDKVRRIVKQPLTEFEASFDELVQQGTLFSAAHRLQIEGIDSYRVYKALDSGMSRLDFITRALFKRGESGTAEFEVLSSLSTEELSQRFRLANFPGFQLKTVRVEGDTIVMRYTRDR